ncbi:hypothetical protein KC207_07585 [Phycicoccus sp. BSK3Z-2]|uniref:Lipoprotein n=1 Tax=Phycicoccus avicenniae TaxID=2828860 RepID=A0A941HZR6_9MICO|nr:hypothetical protein [Phycicoccus avicenniae]MBR7743150.1 hypothetical protein [Phycicoccus avicenniae]
MRTLAAAAVVVAALPLASCSLAPLRDEGTGGGNGTTVTPGTVAVIGLGGLDRDRLGLSDDETVTITGLTVDGDEVGAAAGQVLGVRVYEVEPAGGIGALTTDALDRVEGEPGQDGWDLLDPAGVVLGEAPLGAVVLVRGREPGQWSSDTLVVRYEEGGDPHEERLDVGAVLCVRDDTSAGTCDAFDGADGS